MRRVIGRRDNGIGCHSRACRLPGSEQRSAGRWRVRLGPPAPAPRPSAGRTAGFSLRGRKVGAAGTWGRRSAVTEPRDSSHQSSLDRLKSFKGSDFSSRYALYIGRILSGLGIGIASGTGNAWLAELVDKEDSTRAAIIGTSTNFLGRGLAALVSGS